MAEREAGTGLLDQLSGAIQTATGAVTDIARARAQIETAEQQADAATELERLRIERAIQEARIEAGTGRQAVALSGTSPLGTPANPAGGTIGTQSATGFQLDPKMVLLAALALVGVALVK
ncbi:MAG: hypothetical protein GWO02_05180 [Gammaproteobacteria bacterium]|nr:hypothetical protein [Gammaproteobacteria bacterium]